MKILFTLFVLTIVQSRTLAQIEVQHAAKQIEIGKVRSGTSLIAELSYRVEESDTIYNIIFNNAEYKSIDDYQSISFAEDGGTAQKLYEILKTFFSDENKKNKDYKISLKLGDSQVSLMNMRVMGITSVMFHTPKGYFMLTEKQVDKLFGK